MKIVLHGFITGIYTRTDKSGSGRIVGESLWMNVDIGDEHGLVVRLDQDEYDALKQSANKQSVTLTIDTDTETT